MGEQDNVHARVYAVGSKDERRHMRPSGRVRRAAASDHRTEGQRDRDRIVYSAAWRRLGGVTQVITPFDESPSMHNRLTHSEKVAQVSRSIAELLVSRRGMWDLIGALGGLDVDVCEAAALAHDLGHAPFGHVGEAVLDREARKTLGLVDGFEGNAQSLRLVGQGKVRSNKYEGLDLTFATLSAIAKYPWPRARKKEGNAHEESLREDPTYRREWRKFNVYRPQEPLLEAARQFANEALGPKTQTLEASVMDVADDITYAVHDLEDFYLGGVIDVAAIREDIEDFIRPDGASRSTPFVDLIDRLALDYPGYFSEEELREAAGSVSQALRMGFSWHHSSQALVEARARGMGSDLIGRYIDSVYVSEHALWPSGPHIGLGHAEWHEIQLLKEITRSYVIQRPDVALLQRGQQAVLERLVEMLATWMESDRGRLPPRLREEAAIAEGLGEQKLRLGYGADMHAERGSPHRAILDYICGLTDSQCTSLHQKLSGYEVHRMSFGVGAF